MRDWSDLPWDIIRLLFERMQYLDDILRFSFVCHSWRSIALESWYPYNPLLVLLYEIRTDTCIMYDPAHKKVVQLHLPEIESKVCIGSSRDWLTTTTADTVVHLFHPFLRATVTLPELSLYSRDSTEWKEEIYGNRPANSRWRCSFVEKIILSSNSALNPDCVIVKIGGRGKKISFCRATDEAWTFLYSNWDDYSDAIFFQGRLCCTCRSARIDVWDIGLSRRCSTLEDLPKREIQHEESRGYLVESCGDLLYVIRYLKVNTKPRWFRARSIPYLTFEFDVFKLISFTHEEAEKEASWEWERVTCLGEGALFLGRHQSFSITVNKLSGYKGNHIYFTDDGEAALYPDDVGEYDLDNGSITHYDLSKYRITYPPAWFLGKHA